ncbi:uncharacterized protein [Parasteatoda tepidariorum]|uniref:uncharacterized protein n=1 Tax=Parasteatoda tepidariorum TaxID=114398 RepID=UPI0039BC77DD
MAENEEMVFNSAHRNKSGTSSSPSFNLAKCLNYDPTEAKFLILSSTERKLSSMSPFLVQKSLETNIGNPKNVKQMPSGDLLIETNSKKQTASLLKLTQLGNVKITVIPHNTLNISKGVISDKTLQSLPISEIIEGLSSQGVIDARHITIKKGPDTITTQHIILTFNTSTLPDDIKAGYRNCKVRPYIPNPLRCFKCQKFGHSTNNCRGKETCSRCSETGHTFKTCNQPEKCMNCSESHSGNSRQCPKWKQEKQILNIKVMQKLSYFEAKSKFLSSQPRLNVSYSSVVKTSKTTKSIGIQTDNSESELRNTKLTISPKCSKSLTTTPSQTSNTLKSKTVQLSQQSKANLNMYLKAAKIVLTKTGKKLPSNNRISFHLIQ